MLFQNATTFRKTGLDSGVDFSTYYMCRIVRENIIEVIECITPTELQQNAGD